MTNSRVSRFTSLLVAWCACGGGAKPPMYQLTHSEASIRGAEEVGAPDVPTAALHLKLARDQLIAAKQLIAERVDYDKAKLLLRRAEADAELAITLAKEAQAREEATESKRRIEQLRKENE